jgi:hypothetical protein
VADLRHVVLSVQGSHGFQYGMLRDFESEICRVTGASVVPAPDWQAPAGIRGRLAHGTRFSPLRRFVPRRGDFAVDADVLWFILMGPESSWLDLYRAWDKRVGYRIVYLYDSFEEQLPAIRRLLAAAEWDLLVTSFHGAVPMLERETGKPWIAVPQGVLVDRFLPVPLDKRTIGVSSYGRRVEAVHEAIDRWSDETGVYYDATVATALNPRVPPSYLYKQYAYHLRHSVFTVAWPVELTNPARAGSFSPVTCRWFEAAAAATTMIGRPPVDPVFEELFGEEAVLPLDPAARTPDETREAVAALWARREELHRVAEARRAERMGRWTWEARVREILAAAKIG